MSALTNEKEADQEVIQSLYRTIKKLTRILSMSIIIKSTSGKYYQLHEFEELSAAEVTQLVAEKQAQLSELEAIAPAAEIPAPEAASAPEAAAAPAEAAPAAPEAPAPQPAPPVPAAAPEAPAAAPGPAPAEQTPLQ